MCVCVSENWRRTRESTKLQGKKNGTKIKASIPRTNLVHGIKLQRGKDGEIHVGDRETGEKDRDDGDPVLRAKIVDFRWSAQDRHA